MSIIPNLCLQLVCLVPLVDLVHLGSFVQPKNQTDQINQIDQTNQRDQSTVFLFRRKARDGHRLIAQGNTLGSPSDEAVCQPMLIIAAREVRPVMGPSAFLSGEGADNDGLRDIEQGLELEDLHEISIKYPPFILYSHGRGSM